MLLGAVALVVVFVAQQLRHYGRMQDFLTRYPGTSTSYPLAVTTGFPGQAALAIACRFNRFGPMVDVPNLLATIQRQRHHR